MYDVMLLSIEQKRPSKISCDSIIVEPINTKGQQRKKLYHEIWPFINNTSGILYKIFTKTNLGEFKCGDDLFAEKKERIKIDDIPYIYLKKKKREIVQEDLLSLSLELSYRSQFETVVMKLLHGSPIKTAMFLCRGQSQECEIILGKISYSDFISMLYQGRIYTNICYIIGECY